MKTFLHKAILTQEVSPEFIHANCDERGFVVQFGNQVIVVGEENRTAEVSGRLSDISESTEQLRTVDQQSRLHVVMQKGRLFALEHPEVPILHDSGRFMLVELDPTHALEMAKDDHCFEIRPLRTNEIVFAERAAPAMPPEIPQWEKNLVSLVNADQFRGVLETIAAFPNRHSLNENFDQTVSILGDQMQGFGYSTSVEEIDIFNPATNELVGKSANLVAQKSGLGPNPRGLVLVTAHLDSVNKLNPLDPTLDAPGADDDGSGSAGVMEIARVLATIQSRDDVVFILFGGEEQNLFGSTQFVANLPSAERMRIRAVVNMDMIGVKNAEPASVLLEGAPVSEHVIDGLAIRAAAHTNLIVRTSLNPFASDHVPFIKEGMPAVLTIEGDDDQNSDIHTPADTLDKIHPTFAADILRMNVGYIANRIGRVETS